MFHVPERLRLRGGRVGTDESFGNNGAFVVKIAHGQLLYVIASDGGGWEHVSVSRRDRVPTWDEMCQVKALFWGDDDCVVQFHPPRSDYVNNHSRCLHLWRPAGVALPRPPSLMVGDAALGVLT